LYHADLYREDDMEETGTIEIETEFVVEALRGHEDMGHQMIISKDGEVEEGPSIAEVRRHLTEGLPPLMYRDEVGRHRLPFEAIVTEVGIGVGGERACREFLSWCEMLVLKLPPRICKWPLAELEVFEMFTSLVITFRNSPKALPLSNTPASKWPEKLETRWIDSASRGVS
jgi:hypothetical protein